MCNIVLPIPATFPKLKGSSCYPEHVSPALGWQVLEHDEFKVSLLYIADLKLVQADLLSQVKQNCRKYG